MIPRLICHTVRDSTKSVLLLGPRQVGKSTLIRGLGPDLVINLSDEATFLDFTSNPNELNERIGAQPDIESVFIDEIQRLPAILNTVQSIVDGGRARAIKSYLTGSSARKLRRGHANLLPGRIFAFELDYELRVLHALKYGCLPEPYLSKSSVFCEKFLSTYSGVYLKEETQAEALTRNLEGFSRFIMSAAQQSGLVLDFSKLAKQARIERKICSRFYEILEDTLIVTRLEVFDRTSADVTKRPKFYFFDTGVLNGLLGNFLASNDRKGILFEHLVVNQVLCSAKARDVPVKLSYFRTRGGYEIDLVLEMGHKIYAVEIKSGRVNQQDAAHLEEFRGNCEKLTGLFLVTLDEVPRKIGRVTVTSLSGLLCAVDL